VSTEPGHRGGVAGYEPTSDEFDGGLHPLRAFRRWRNTRPFWGALFVILSAGVILLSEQAPISVVVHLGLQGLAGYLIPVIMLLCGFLLLVNPVQRTFYSLLVILLSLGSFITSNLGGFFVGMLLGLLGGSLAFAWEQRDGHGREHRAGGWRGWPPGWMRQRSADSQGISLLVGEPDDTRELPRVSDGEPSGPGSAPDPDRGHPGGTYGAMAVSATAFSLLLVLGPLQSHAAGSKPHGPEVLGWISGQLPSQPGGLPIHVGGRVLPHATRKHKLVAPPFGGAATARSDLTASVATLTGASYDGVAHIPTAHGTVAMLEFSMTTLLLSGSTIRAAAAGGTILARAPSLGLTGDVVLLATKVSWYLHGKRVTYTPKRPPTSVPRDVTFMHLVTRQPYLTAAYLQATALRIATSQGT
jgi:hypothetical protein